MIVTGYINRGGTEGPYNLVVMCSARRCDVSTREFLKKLDIDQLRRAKEIADETISAIEAEKKVRLWVIDDGNVNVACFSDDDFRKAKEKVCEIIMSDDFTKDDVFLSHPRIDRCMAYESEVSGWMELNT